MVFSESTVCWLAFLATLVALSSQRPEAVLKLLVQLATNNKAHK